LLKFRVGGPSLHIPELNKRIEELGLEDEKSRDWMIPSGATLEQKSAKNAEAAAWLSSLSASLRFRRNTSLT
jgi:hypothetical protein